MNSSALHGHRDNYHIIFFKSSLLDLKYTIYCGNKKNWFKNTGKNKTKFNLVYKLMKNV